MSEQKFDSEVEDLLQRLDAHRAVVEQDQGAPLQLTMSPRQNLSTAAHAGVNELIDNLEESFKDLRVVALEKLRAYREEVRWSLPAGAKARSAPFIIARVYRNGRSFEDYVRELARRKELSGNHLADEMVMLAMMVDRAIAEAPPEWMNYKTTEVALRRLYALERAFEPVRGLHDWKPPKNPSKHWRSKVLLNVMDEIDVGSMDPDGHGIESVDREVRERLKDRALIAKSLAHLGGGAASSQESA